MSGHLERKGENWYIVIEDGDGSGRKRRWISVRKELGLDRPALKREARELLARIQVEQQEGSLIKPSGVTVGEYLKHWLENYARPTVKQKTYDIYKNMIDNHLVPSIGKIEVPKLKPSRLKGLYAEKLKGGRADGKEGGLSSRSVQYMHMVLKLALRHAIEDELIKYNIAERVTPPSVKKPQIKYWIKQQQKAFLDFTRQDRYHLLYLLALSTGMRRGEILGLRWQDIDFNKNRIYIRQQIVQTGKGSLIQEATKTDAGARMLDISANLMDKLKAHRKKQAQEFLVWGRPEVDYGLVFTTTTRNLVAPRNIDHRFRLAIERYNKAHKDKLPMIGLHGLRHSYATRLLEDGVHPKVVQERLGHASVKITLDTYSHVIPRLQKEVATLTDDLLE